MKTRNPLVIYAACLGFGLLYWVLDGVYDYLTFAHTIRQMIFHEPLRLMDAIVLNVPPNDLIARTSFLVACLGLGTMLHLFMNREAQARKRLREEEARFRFLSNVASEGILIHDGNRVVHVNTAFADITSLRCDGWLLDEMVNRLVTPDDQDHVRKALNENYPRPFEFRINIKEAVAHLHAQVRPSTLEGRTLHVLFVRNVTQEKESEATLTRERNLLRTVIDRSKDIIFLIDEQGRFQLCNDELANFFGLSSAQDIKGRRMSDLLPSLEAERALGVDQRVLRSGEPEIDYEETWHGPTGQAKRFSTTKAPVPGDKSIPAGILAVMRDVTDRRAREKAELDREAALASSRAKSRFLAHMSHEIRTPLNSVLGASELLRETGLTGRQSDLVDLLDSSGKVLSALVGDILDLSKIESGRMQLDKQDFELQKLLDEIMRPHQIAAKAKGITLSMELALDLPRRVLGDPVRLRQVLFNILGNAIKFTKQGSVKLHVEKTPELHMLSFQIQDTGIGISHEQHRLIFQSFTQVRADSTREFGGTGLGLSIARHLVELMDGDIHLRSTPGEGSTFTFTACLPEVPEHSQARPQKKVAPGTLVRETPIRVLLVEDNRNNQLLAQHFLQGTDYIVDVVENGSEALERFDGNRYDIVLMDMEMPIMDGYTATEHIREAEQANGHEPTPIIALTANAMAEARQRCMGAGCTDYLAKPLSKSELLNAIGAHLETRVD